MTDSEHDDAEPIHSYLEVGPGQEPPTESDAIRADIAQTRAELAQTVDQLAEKLDVKSQVGKKAESVRDSVKQATSERAAQVKASAPEPVQHSLDAIADKTGPALEHTRTALAPHRKQLLAAAVASAAALLIVRRARKRSQS